MEQNNMTIDDIQTPEELIATMAPAVYLSLHQKAEQLTVDDVAQAIAQGFVFTYLCMQDDTDELKSAQVADLKKKVFSACRIDENGRQSKKRKISFEEFISGGDGNDYVALDRDFIRNMDTAMKTQPMYNQKRWRAMRKSFIKFLEEHGK